MSIEKGDATKYVHTGNGELCYELNKALPDHTVALAPLRHLPSVQNQALEFRCP